MEWVFKSPFRLRIPMYSSIDEILPTSERYGFTLKHNLPHKSSSCYFCYQRQRFLPFPTTTTVTLEPHQRCGWSSRFFCLSSFHRNIELRSRCWLDATFFYHNVVFTVDMHRPTSVLVGSVGIEPLYAITSSACAAITPHSLY